MATKLDEALAVLGFDPTKKGAIPKDAVSSALAEIHEEATAKQKADAKRILLDLSAILEKKVTLEKEFGKAVKKIDGEAGQLLARLRGQNTNEPQSQGGSQVSQDAAE